MSAMYGSLAVLGLPMRTPEEALARSQAVTVEDIRRVAARVIREDALHLSIVGTVDAEPLGTAFSLGN